MEPASQWAMVPYQGGGSGTSGKKGKGKGSSKSKGGAKRQLPSTAFYTQTKSGKQVCPDFNSPGGCPNGALFQGLMSCPKGLHLCWAPRSLHRNAHGFPAHTKADE